MELEDLRTFIAVADAGGLSPAARRLGVSKSIVSRRIFRLEEALGVRLLSRTTRGACLTESGSIFARHGELVTTFGHIARVIAEGGRGLRALT